MKKHFLALFGILPVIFLASCHHHDTPEPEPTPVMVDKAVVMYMPWSGGGSIYSACLKNIQAMETAVEYRKGLGNTRLVVFIASTANRAHLIDIKYENGECVEDTLKTYEYLRSTDYTSVNGMISLFKDIEDAANAKTYGMVVSAHGTGWLPNKSVQAALSKKKMMKRVGEFEGEILETRYFGTAVNGDASFHTEIADFEAALANTFRHLDFLLFDDCYMQNIETAFILKNITDYIVASTCEVLMIGLPYATVGGCLFNNDYAGIVNGFYDFFIDYVNPYGTLSVVKTSELDETARIMKEINSRKKIKQDDIQTIQELDGYGPTVFFDMGSYVRVLCDEDQVLYNNMKAQLEKLVPYKCHTPMFYSAEDYSKTVISEYSGITCSDPSLNEQASDKNKTLWWRATHE